MNFQRQKEKIMSNKSKKQKVSVVFGTRPELIKLAPIITKLQQNSNIELTVINTGQHKELTDQILEFFQIEITYNLEVMKKNQPLISLTAKLLEAVGECLEREKPDLLIVQGDTTTAMSAAMAAFYLKIKVAHVEAGMRTFDIWQPFPEEFNRKCIGSLANWHFTPCKEEKEHLIKEGYSPSSIYIVGNTVVDALQMILHQNKINKAISKDTRELLSKAHTQKMVLITAHRRENFGQPIQDICSAISHLAIQNQSHLFLFITHPNPNVKEVVEKELKGIENVAIYPPFDYFNFIHLLNASYCILTDSGGIQEEAAVLKKPIFILRNKTERVQGVDLGVAKLIGTNQDSIVTETEKILHTPSKNQEMLLEQGSLLYGTGDTSEKILKIVLHETERVD